MTKVLNNSYPTRMVCECQTLVKEGVNIHPLPTDPEQDVCINISYIKFEVDGEGIWLCTECMPHHIEVDTLGSVRIPPFRRLSVPSIGV